MPRAYTDIQKYPAPNRVKSAPSDIDKITRHTKRQENGIHDEGKKPIKRNRLRNADNRICIKGH